MTGWLKELQEVGASLDADRDLEVCRGGIVRPSEPISASSSMGLENHRGSEQQQQHRQQRGPATGSWQGAARREGTPGGSRPPGPASPLVLGDFASDYEEELRHLGEQYPGVTQVPQKDGFWLRVECALLRKYGGKALFCVAVPYQSRIPRAWAFLREPLSGFRWVGPRHANYPDGSICAFHLDDRTWRPGDKLVTLLDLYSVWVVRHLHLEHFGRWPGLQAVTNRYERLTESRDDERCGCGSGAAYRDCHKARDASNPDLAEITRTALFERHPPEDVVRWATLGGCPPHLYSGLA